jgi:predicted ATP-grasp superfamily ATP-dependent carboligase
VYVGGGGRSWLLGVTRQLVGETWLHAAPFHYCGSVGPLPLGPALRQAFDDLGAALVAGFGLQGLFGVDCVLREGAPWPVEVNPRYTASVEVLEYATGVPALALHRRAFEPDAAVPPAREGIAPVVGKAVLFARAPLSFPAWPWIRGEGMPGLADIPRAGERIEAGKPVVTVFAAEFTVARCEDVLRQVTGLLDRWLVRQ